MNAKDLPEYVRLHSLRLWHLAKYKYHGVRVWKLKKQLAFLRWQQSVLERWKTIRESRRFQYGESDE